MFTVELAFDVNVNPPLDAYTPLFPVVGVEAVFNIKYGLELDVRPLALSNTYQLPVESVRFIRINLAPLAPNPQAIDCPVPLPVYEPTLETPGQVANR